MKRASLRRRLVDLSMRGLLGVAVAVAIAPLVWILFDVARRGISAVKGLEFLTKGPPGDPSAVGGGVANGIIGTFLMVGIATAIAVPVGILGAVYLVEFSLGGRLASGVRFFADVMTGLPSIVFGIFVYSVIVIATGSFSALSGALALALIMWPIVLRTSEEMLRLVPREVREGALALGVPRWRAVLRVILPSAAAGITTGSLLALARAAGETAPLLFTALGNQFIAFRLDHPMSALSLEIFRQATTAYDAANARAWAAAATLIGIVLVASVAARTLAARRRRA
ncbi:MAG: phosphate ABC transporter permease PstA [Actinomycetota bacterium]